MTKVLLIGLLALASLSQAATARPPAAKAKFQALFDGKPTAEPIALQDHGHQVAIRAITIEQL
jgi:hypothetical protein